MTNYTSLERSHWDLSIAIKMKVFWLSRLKLWLIWWFFLNSRRASEDSWEPREITLQRVSFDWPSVKWRVKRPFCSYLSITVDPVILNALYTFVCCITEIEYNRIIGLAWAWNCYYMISDYYHFTMSVELAALLHNISYSILPNLLFESFTYMDFWQSKIYDLD